MDADPFDLRDELALNRALLADALSRLGGEDGKERLDGDAIDMLNGIINSIRKLVEAISKIKNDTALTAAEVTYIAVRMVGLLDKYIDDPAKREAFKQELFKFALPEDAALGAGEGFDNL